MPSFKEIALGECAWEWKQADSGDDQGWRNCSRFPTNIHHELRVLDTIPDAGIELNERKLQWVGEKDWIFRTSFTTPSNIGEYIHTVLAFHGLDTIAKVTLNGNVILECDNMFTPQRVEVGKNLATEGENKLEIYFTSAARVARERMEKSGLYWQAIREQSRVYLRKAQYHWGWDWGPSVITCGPWKDVRLEIYDTRIVDVHADVKLDEQCESAKVDLVVELEGSTDSVELKGCIEQNGSNVGTSTTASSKDDKTSHLSFTIDKPDLWWPVGHGNQPLYEATVQLNSGGGTMQTTNLRFGIRKVELVRRPLKSVKGETFFFRINNRPIFCHGTNWIPCHSLPAMGTPEMYERNLKYALEDNNNMIRIWGGGIYEHDAFYNYCDEHGIMIWHDMMFACGIYPIDDSFHDSVTEELEAQIRRLRNHPSITLWNGDNEVFFMYDRQGVPYDASVEKNWDIYKDRKLFFKTIPDVITKLSPEIPYWPSSPFGGKDANDPTIGDVHQWQVWHNLGLHYQQYPQLGGRFVSEYGMHGLPDMRTVKYYCPDPREQYPNSRIMDTHNKSGGAEQKLPKYLGANFRLDYTNLKQTIYCSQLMQCDALSYANRAWRRGWKGEGHEECAGILIWQLNDIYPCTSWALVDSFFRKKPAFYTTKRDFAPIIVGISRIPTWYFVDENKRSEHPTDIPKFEVYASNLSIAERDVELRLRIYDWSVHKEIELDEKVKRQFFKLKANQATELLQMDSPKEVQESSYIILAATLHDSKTGDELSRHFSWPEPFRYLYAAPNSSVDVKTDGEAVTLTCGTYPVKGLLACIDEADGDEADWQDNMYDLMPGESITLAVRGLNGRNVKTKWLYSWES